MAKVAFLGLGVMGFPMAGHLAAKGHEVTVYNRTFAKAEEWTQKHKGKAARTPRSAMAPQLAARARRTGRFCILRLPQRPACLPAMLKKIVTTAAEP